MDTKVNDPGPVAAPRRTAPAQQATVPVGAVAAPPEKVETPQAVPAADTAQKAAIGPAAPTSALTTYKDQDSGRLIVRVYDPESGDVLVEFPPEKAFRPAAAAPDRKSTRLNSRQ